jgi:hypothetical protein
LRDPLTQLEKRGIKDRAVIQCREDRSSSGTTVSRNNSSTTPVTFRLPRGINTLMPISICAQYGSGTL